MCLPLSLLSSLEVKVVLDLLKRMIRRITLRLITIRLRNTRTMSLIQMTRIGNVIGRNTIALVTSIYQNH